MSNNWIKHHPVLAGGSVGLLISAIFFASSLHPWIAALAGVLMKPANFVMRNFGLSHLAQLPCMLSSGSDDGAFLCGLSMLAICLVLTNVFLFGLAGYIIVWIMDENAKSKNV